MPTDPQAQLAQNGSNGVAAQAPAEGAPAATAAAGLRALLDTVDQQLLRPDAGDFVGRDFVRKDIADHLAVKNRMLVLVSPQGVGKTALAAQLIREHVDDPMPYLGYFCGLSGNDNPFVFCSALAELLERELGGYTLPETAQKQQVNIQTNLTVGQAGSGTRINGLTLNVGGMHPREAFRQLVREPLRAYDAKHGRDFADKPLLIVIDGVERAWDWDGGQDGNIVSVLADAQDLPPWVNLICTARPGPAVRALRNQAGVRVIDLLNERDAQNRADIAAFIRTRFLDRLPAGARGRFDIEIAGLDGGGSGADHVRAFVDKVTELSGGNFLFVRRYVDALNAALLASDSRQSNTATLLAFDKVTLSSILDDSYAEVLGRLRAAMSAQPGDADEDVLAALAIAFAPLNMALLTCLTGRDEGAVRASLDNSLNGVLEPCDSADGCAYALYHRGFADYVRRTLAQQARQCDVDAATRLDQSSSDDALLRDYRARYRWSHLLRGLDLAAATADADAAPGGARAAAPVAPSGGLDSLDPIARAQLLRALAARALDPSPAEASGGRGAGRTVDGGVARGRDGGAAGSWAAALGSLRAAQQALRNSRALAYTRRRGWRVETSGPASPELIELERTLIAQGDAYGTIARRMDGGGQRPSRPTGLFGALHLVWDMIVRLPLTIYLLMVLLLQGVREIHVPGALQNLGRAQDWTVARLCVLSVSAYRRARRMAHARGDDESVAVIHERLAALYMLMGAYDSAASSYEALLARPASIARPWRQAIWRLALGEVLVIQGKADQAVEALNSALLVFKAQQAPIQQARALSALAAAHQLRADAADARGDSRLTTVLDQEAIETCAEALTAWRDITTLQGDESASVDPALAISYVGHQLWRAERNPRMGDEQRRDARQLLDTIKERHYPQRFEHPVLRLFRIGAAILLPAYLLVGLLMAVQLPSTVQIQTQTSLDFASPLVDLTRFPNDQISGRATGISADESRAVSAFSPVNLTKLASSTVDLQAAQPRLDPLGTTRALLLIMGAYLLAYTLLGLAVLTLSSPAQYQHRRPGRLILGKNKQGRHCLSWHGPAGQGSLMDALAWMGQDVRGAGQRLRDWLRRALWGGAARVSPAPASRGPAAGDLSLELGEIEQVISIDRCVFGYLMRDFSVTLIQPRNPPRAKGAAARRPVLLPGTVLHYEELCDELELRMDRRRSHFDAELVRSWSGVCFLIALAYTLALVALLPLVAGLLTRAIPPTSYSPANLYVIAAPGMLLPLLWWFVAKPLGANAATANRALPLIATALAAAALTAGVLTEQISLAALGLRPDLATPVLAAGFLIALVCFAPPRPLRRIFEPWPENIARTLLAFLALGGLALLCWRVGTTLRWYDALIAGNRLVERALAPEGCAGRKGRCAQLDDAVDRYTQVICLRPRESEGYAFRGFANLARRQYDAAREDFERALGDRPSTEACAAGVAPRPSAAQRTSLYANIGAVETLLARQPPLARNEVHYQAALQSYARALGLSSAGDALGCRSMAVGLLRPDGDDLLSAGARAIEADQAPIVLQLADACYSRGSARIELLGLVVRQARGLDRDTARANAWLDLEAAIALYRGVAQATADDPKSQSLALHGLASTWLAISHIDRPPPGSPDHNTALLRAMETFQTLERSEPGSAEVYTGHAWSSIKLNAWDGAALPLAAARERSPNDPTYPALQGLVAWLDSTQYPPPKKGAPSPGYTSAIRAALERYAEVISIGQANNDLLAGGKAGPDVVAIGQSDMARAYATRSLLYFSLRNSPTGLNYVDEDYGAWMRLALADADQALLAAQRDGLPPERQVGYRYWRARLSFALALTWQEKTRGLHGWSELASLYGSAYQDYAEAAAIDLNPERRKIFQETWIPWCRALLANATHMQLAHDAAQRGDFATARGELALVNPSPALVRKWDPLSAPLPDYHYLHGLVSLGLGLPPDFPNPLIKPEDVPPGASDGEASYAAAIAATENGDVVPQPRVDYPDDSRPALYRVALADLDRLLAQPPIGWNPAARAAAERLRAELKRRLDVVAK